MGAQGLRASIAKAEPFLTLPPLFDHRMSSQLKNLRLPYGVVLDEMLQLRNLMMRQAPKLKAASPHGDGTKRDLVGSEISNGSREYVIQMKVAFFQEYV
jgi:hypothetical protein